MMYPPLIKVRWNLVLLTMVQNWVLGPFVLFFLSSAFCSGDVGYMTGLSLVGCACCIAMDVVWNSLAGGDAAYCAAMVAMNAL
ncbi:arsenical-resistance protein [Phytophthora cinnamomi]|uniref:arsenical-resistance protein n=1 Tax=Phytophthora cinnamomi TaxID=4785 RepID=UPI00355AB350|nr:arsenical-resistance protein [Phytophthora cinnamomi]